MNCDAHDYTCHLLWHTPIASFHPNSIFCHSPPQAPVDPKMSPNSSVRTMLFGGVPALLLLLLGLDAVEAADNECFHSTSTHVTMTTWADIGNASDITDALTQFCSAPWLTNKRYHLYGGVSCPPTLLSSLLPSVLGITKLANMYPPRKPSASKSTTTPSPTSSPSSTPSPCPSARTSPSPPRTACSSAAPPSPNAPRTAASSAWCPPVMTPRPT